MTKLSLLLAFLLCASGAWAADYRDHLLPEDSVWGDSDSTPDYPIIVRDVLHEAYDRDVKLRFVDLPSFQPEFALALREDSGSYRIVTLEPAIQLWQYESLAMMKNGRVLKMEGNDFEHGVKPVDEIAKLESALPSNYRDIKLKRCETSLDPSMAQRIIAVWKAMLLQTRFTQPGEDDVVVSDGVQEHYSMLDEMQFLAGWTNYASPGGRLAALESIALAMSDYCDKPGQDALAKLNNNVSSLEALLQSNQRAKSEDTH